MILNRIIFYLPFILHLLLLFFRLLVFIFLFFILDDYNCNIFFWDKAFSMNI